MLLRRQDVNIVTYMVKQSGHSGSVPIANSILPYARHWTVIAMPCSFDVRRDEWTRHKSAKSPGPETPGTSMQTRSHSGESQN